MRRCDHRLRRAFPLLNEIDDLALAARIERCRRLVQQQHLGIEHQDRSQRDPFLLAAGEAIGRTVAKMRDRPCSSSVCSTSRQYLFLRPLQLQRREGDFVEHRGIEQLHIGILEDQRHAPPKGKCEVVALKQLGGQLLASKWT